MNPAREAANVTSSSATVLSVMPSLTSLTEFYAGGRRKNSGCGAGDTLNALQQKPHAELKQLRTDTGNSSLIG